MVWKFFCYLCSQKIIYSISYYSRSRKSLRNYFHRVIINMNCTFVDNNLITIEDDVLIASNVHIITATHPIRRSERMAKDWPPSVCICRTYAKPVKICSGAWIGGSVTILPGVTIGENSVIGAGSVVTRSIPANSVAFGNPCRVARQIDNNDQ